MEADPKMGDYLDAWIEQRRSHMRPYSVQTFERCIRTYLRPWIGELRLTALDRRTLERFYATLLERGGSGGGALTIGTVRLVHTVVRGALRDAVIDGMLPANPAEDARTPRRHPDAVELDDEPPKVWNVVQTARFLNAVADHRLRAVWHLAVWTGARRGELLGLRWVDVDLDRASIVIRRSLSVVDGTAWLLQTKTSNTRVLTIGKTAVAELHRRREEQERQRAEAGDRWDNGWGLVMTQPTGRYLAPNSISAAFRNLVRSIDVPAIPLHNVRHTHASLMLGLGASMHVISQRLGHASITTTMDTYAHILPPMDEDATRRFDAQVYGARRKQADGPQE